MTENHEQAATKDGALSALIVDILNAPEIRKVLTDVSGEWLRHWGGNSTLKLGVGKPLDWMLSRMLSPSGTTDLAGIFEQPEHIEALAQTIPTMIRGMSSILLSVVHAVESFPPDRKKALFDGLFSGQNLNIPGDALSSLARIAEDLYADEPFFFSSRLVPALEKRMADTDFGELKSLLDTARPDLDMFLNKATGLLFEYPAKLITVLSLAPDGFNLIVSLINHLLGHVNALPPDILTDLLLSLFKQVDATTLGQNVNRLNEVIRQIHTGSTLIGELDAPRFTADLKDKVQDMLAQIDPELAIKARNDLIDGRETLITSLIDTAEGHPDLLNLWLSQLTAMRNSNLRILKRKISVLETLPEADTVSALSAGLSSWNAYDLAQTVNAVSRMINRIHGFNPGVIRDLVTECVNSLDRYELEESLDWLCRDLGRAIRPVFRMAAPPIIREFCDFFTPGEEDDGYDEAMGEARDHLSRVFGTREDA